MTGAPPRGREERLRDTRAKLENDIDLWVATSGSPGGVHLVPLSYLWDGTAFLISTTPGGFFGVHEEWVGIPVWLSAISEIGAIVLGTAAILVERRAPATSSTRRVTTTAART
jgi:hypothetical protein